MEKIVTKHLLPPPVGQEFRRLQIAVDLLIDYLLITQETNAPPEFAANDEGDGEAIAALQADENSAQLAKSDLSGFVRSASRSRRRSLLPPPDFSSK
jgi:hypothetical protein